MAKQWMEGGNKRTPRKVESLNEKAQRLEALSGVATIFHLVTDFAAFAEEHLLIVAGNYLEPITVFR